MSPAADGGVPEGGAASDSPLEALRTQLETIDDVPVAERVEVFEVANATLTAALSELDEV